MAINNSTSASAKKKGGKASSSSHRRRSATSTSGGAAEPEPEPPSTSTATSTGYNVRDYQNPDAGAKDLPRTKASGKTKGKGKKKGGASPHACFHCGKPGAGSSCAHCGRDCQVADWKRHRRSCRAAVAAVARRATRARKATAAARAAGGCAANEERVICVGPVVAPVELPCGHAFSGGTEALLVYAHKHWKWEGDLGLWSNITGRIWGSNRVIRHLRASGVLDNLTIWILH